MSKNPLSTYENEMEKLEAIVQALESGELPLDDALKQYEQGIALIRRCQQALENAEQKILQLSQENGEETLRPLKDDRPNPASESGGIPTPPPLPPDDIPF